MKTRIVAPFAAVLFLLLNTVASAQRPSTDEVAIRLGVSAWFSGRTTIALASSAASLKALYRPELEATDTVNGTARVARGLPEYVTLWQPFFDSLASLSAPPAGEVKLSIDGVRAVTSFSFVPQGTYTDGRSLTCGASVRLTWTKHDGLWQIAREEVGPLPPALTSDPARATSQR